MDGGPLACGTRLARSALPAKELDVVITTALYEGDDALSGVNELPDEEIQAKARDVAVQIAAKHLTDDSARGEPAGQEACCACS